MQFQLCKISEAVGRALKPETLGKELLPISAIDKVAPSIVPADYSQAAASYGKALVNRTSQEPFGQTPLTRGFHGIAEFMNERGQKVVALIKRDVDPNGTDKKVLRIFVEGKEKGHIMFDDMSEDKLLEQGLPHNYSYNGIHSAKPIARLQEFARGGGVSKNKELWKRLIQASVEESKSLGYEGRLVMRADSNTIQDMYNLGFRTFPHDEELLESLIAKQNAGTLDAEDLPDLILEKSKKSIAYALEANNNESLQALLSNGGYNMYLSDEGVKQFSDMPAIFKKTDISAMPAKVAEDLTDLEISTLLKSVKCGDKPKFTADEIEDFTIQIKELLNCPETKEFTETLLKNESLDKMSLKYIFSTLSKDNVELYERLYTEKMSDGTQRFIGLTIPQASNALKSEDDCFKVLYEAMDSTGSPRFSGNDILGIQQNINMRAAMKAGIDFNPLCGFMEELSPKMKGDLLEDTNNVLKLRNANGQLLTGQQLSFLSGLETLSSKLNITKLLKAKAIKDLSLADRKELLYSLEMTKQQISQMTQMLEEQGMDVKQILPDFKKLNLPFIHVDEAGKLDTKKLATSLVEDSRNLIKVRPLASAKLLRNFKTGMADLENILRFGKIDVANIKTINLKYPRANFVSDVKKATTDLNEQEAIEFTRTFGFELVNDDIVQYPIKAIPEEISQITNPKIRQAVERFNANVERFTVGNNVSIPESPELEKALNLITSVYPEFLTTIGKSQHGAHTYTLDLHILKTMQEALKDPKWEKLNETDKKLAKIAILFHDIAKTEGQADKLHHIVSAQDVAALLEKSDLSEIEKERVVGLIRNHHWLEQINQPMPQDEADMLGLKLAFEFRKPNDWQIAQIFAKADLKATSNEVYQSFGCVLEHPLVEQISQNIDKIHSAAVFLPQTIIPKASQLRNIEISAISTLEGITNNKIIYLTDNNDLVSMGFAKGTTPETFRALVHVISPENRGFIQMLDSATQEGANGVFSTSYVTKDRVATLFGDGKSKVPGMSNFSNSGIIFHVDNNNIAAAYPQDMDSGRMKSVADIMNYLFVNKPEHEATYLRMLAEKGNESSIYAKLQGNLQGATKFEDIKSDAQREGIKTLFERRLRHRNYIASKVKTSLNLSDEEYAKLIREISQYKSVDGIEDHKVRKAFTEAADSLIDYKNAPDHKDQFFEPTWNEAVAYAPKPQAVFAKSCTPEEIPFELRKYAQDHNLPIVIFGKDISA